MDSVNQHPLTRKLSRESWAESNPKVVNGEVAGSGISGSSIAENFDNFIKILTTQLKSQDPLSPMDSHEFTNQLVMFADLEQSNRQSARLEELVGFQKANGASQALSYIGQTVEAANDAFNFDGTPQNLHYVLPEDVSKLEVTIVNDTGKIVRTINAIPKEAGGHDLTWDGKNGFGTPQPPGTYRFKVAAADADDTPVQAHRIISGTVTGIEYDPKETLLKLGDVQISQKDLVRVTVPHAKGHPAELPPPTIPFVPPATKPATPAVADKSASTGDDT